MSSSSSQPLSTSEANAVTRAKPEIGMEIHCPCDGMMRLVSYQEFDDRVEERFECPECDEKVLIFKDRKWEETVAGD